MDERPYRLKVTQFAIIDGAMLRVIKAQSAYKAARYSVGERAAMENVLKAAAQLKAAFEKVEKEINERHAAQDEATRGGLAHARQGNQETRR